MGLRLGDDAPNFTAETTEGTINFHEWLGGGWGILFSHPEGLYPRLYDRIGLYGEDQRGVR
jgi:alkyl hydroperoxide reductase subunit AhpC